MQRVDQLGIYTLSPLAEIESALALSSCSYNCSCSGILVSTAVGIVRENYIHVHVNCIRFYMHNKYYVHVA